MNIDEQLWDLIVIGGGINGAGIAADAASRGLKVLLCEKNDLASATSSNSSKLIHGGLRYLEHYEFKLVRKALKEREVLLENAPHIMWPLRFYLPHRPHLRPAWMIRIGLFLYDHLSQRKRLAGSKFVHFGADSPLKPFFKKGFEYSDGWVDDSRLVVLNAQQAHIHGAEILPRHKCIKARHDGQHWFVELENQIKQSLRCVKSKVVVNAAGPWVEDLFIESFDKKPPRKIRLVKGSHIVVPKLHDQSQAYILQNQDKRIVFVLPFEDDFSLIGTTDVDYQGDPGDVEIEQSEIDYLIKISNEHFIHQISEQDIVHCFSGVRPLMDDESDDAQSVTRDYTLHLEDSVNMPPLLSVFGGKITTYRKLAEAAVDKIAGFFGQIKPCQTRALPLPGGNFSDPKTLLETLQSEYPWLPAVILKRYVRSYGQLSRQILAGCQSIDDMGIAFNPVLYQVEVDYLIEHEWVSCAEDLLWRRTKTGLLLNAGEVVYLRGYVLQKLINKQYY
ncbi:glycerol-3-phosphate dehydrogenase [Gayadomonas joobiniege]|uniref:glycerol-3-phosphate dehydrogenase n=1 Tax=Gayadomonas joobiniege TaxID=1234606 RepID=UPI000379B433|nr:glycerol-3-phosphate dehydrogenase [Gayadomonas joobiniege]